MENNLACHESKNFYPLTLDDEARSLFDENGQQEMAFIFRDKLSQHRLLLKETFGMHRQQQQQICFLCESLLGSALYFEVKTLQNALLKLKDAAIVERAEQSLLDAVNQEIDLLLDAAHDESEYDEHKAPFSASAFY